ncbi:hypothetical protein BGY98DRAFT_936034 [Russula aff. rugulosa BPL654]|nr:hypothetical protein BGY98DRAFT_936034 [Russula aff. rugulosa BPL654]
MEPDTPRRGGRMSHCSQFDSGVCVMHIFGIMNMPPRLKYVPDRRLRQREHVGPGVSVSGAPHGKYRSESFIGASVHQFGTRELDVVPEKPVVGPEPSQVSSEETEQGALAFGEAQPYQAVVPILQEVLLVSEERPIDRSPAPLIPSDRLSSLEASDMQSEHISPFLEFPRPTPTLHLRRFSCKIARPFPVTNDHEDQGYGTQEEEDWGSVEAQPTYESTRRRIRSAGGAFAIVPPAAEANAAEAKKLAVLEQRELQAKLDEALEQAQSALQKASCAAEANEQSQRELTEMYAELEARKSESAAFCLRLADNENGCTKSKAEAAISSLRWNEKSFEMMECRNEGQTYIQNQPTSPNYHRHHYDGNDNPGTVRCSMR